MLPIGTRSPRRFPASGIDPSLYNPVKTASDMLIVTKMLKTRTQQKILKSLDMRSDDTIPDQAYWEAQENRPLCVGIFGTPKSASTFVWRIFLDLAGAPESRSTFDQTKTIVACMSSTSTTSSVRGFCMESGYHIVISRRIRIHSMLWTDCKLYAL